MSNQTKKGAITMDTARLLIQNNKTAFDNTFSAIIVLQDQLEKMLNYFMEQNKLLPDEVKKLAIFRI
jgi:hypothetical protein